MDSQDQAVRQSTSEQPEVESTTEQPQGSEQVETVEVNGEQVPLDELKQGYMRQSDYTRKTQELSNLRKEVESEKTSIVRNAEPSNEVQLDDDVKQAAEVLKKAGFVTNEDLKLQEKKLADERKLQALIDANPDLASKEEAIRAIGKTDNRAWEDIVDAYGFKESSKILKAKARGIKGEPVSKEPVKEKSVKDMTPEEYADWKKKHLKGSTF